jgi:hypothetical protein
MARDLSWSVTLFRTRETNLIKRAFFEFVFSKLAIYFIFDIDVIVVIIVGVLVTSFVRLLAALPTSAFEPMTRSLKILFTLLKKLDFPAPICPVRAMLKKGTSKFPRVSGARPAI